MKIENLANNQIIVTQDNGTRTFNSYGVNVGQIDSNGTVTLDPKYYDYSNTTRKHLSKFLGHKTDVTRQRVANGEYKLDNLN